MNSAKLIAAALVCGVVAAPASRADDVQYEDVGGVRYQITRQVVQRPITETHYEARDYTAYRERYTTDLHETQRTYQVPVVENQWVPGYQRSWNLFAPPVLSYRLMPVTRWETRSETVRIPVTKRELVPQVQTQQVPVTSQRIVTDEHTHRVAMGVSSNGTPTVARNNASSLAPADSEPPRQTSPDWHQGLETRRP